MRCAGAGGARVPLPRAGARVDGAHSGPGRLVQAGMPPVAARRGASCHVGRRAGRGGQPLCAPCVVSAGHACISHCVALAAERRAPRQGGKGGKKAAAPAPKEADADPHGAALAAVADPLAEAARLARALRAHAGGPLRTHVLAFEARPPPRRPGRSPGRGAASMSVRVVSVVTPAVRPCVVSAYTTR